jgi:hypothetical protein
MTKTALGTIALLAISTCCARSGSGYDLPIALGSSSDEVRRVLGAPDSSFTNDRGQTTESFNSHGLQVEFDRDRVFAVSVQQDVGDQSGSMYVPYSGSVVHGVKLSDTRPRILQELGKPTKIEDDPLEPNTDPAVPVVWPKYASYFWRFEEYSVEVLFLKQAMLASEEPKITLPQGAVKIITIRK